jgi:hypothetical protein
MAESWRGSNEFPLQNCLYYGVGCDGGINGKGEYQAIIGNPEDYSTGDPAFDDNRLFISPSLLSDKAKNNLEKYSGLGDFEAMPTAEEIVIRLEQLGE